MFGTPCYNGKRSRKKSNSSPPLPKQINCRADPRVWCTRTPAKQSRPFPPFSCAAKQAGASSSARATLARVLPQPAASTCTRPETRLTFDVCCLSRDCQKNHWKNGHKRECEEPEVCNICLDGGEEPLPIPRGCTCSRKSAVIFFGWYFS